MITKYSDSVYSHPSGFIKKNIVDVIQSDNLLSMLSATNVTSDTITLQLGLDDHLSAVCYMEVTPYSSSSDIISSYLPEINRAKVSHHHNQAEG